MFAKGTFMLLGTPSVLSKATDDYLSLTSALAEPRDSPGAITSGAAKSFLTIAYAGHAHIPTHGQTPRRTLELCNVPMAIPFSSFSFEAFGYPINY